MEALSPRSANIPTKASKDSKYGANSKSIFAKEEAARKAQETAKKAEEAAKRAKMNEQRKAQKAENHAQPPPAYVIQPPGIDGAPGQQYLSGRLLGKGGFAICYEGTLTSQKAGGKGNKFALKIVKSTVGQKKMQEKFRTELQIHSKMRHPNIVEFHCAFTFGESTYIVLELCPHGSIMEMVKKRKCLSLPEVRRYSVQLCGAVKYMHARNVIHRDLKMGNLFLDEKMNIKIGDFGLAAVLVTESEVKGASRRTTLCGTPNYIAPEILEKGRKGHDHKVDLWAVGIIIFAMLTGYPPFASACQDDIYRKVKELDYSWPTEKCANDIPAEAESLVASLLTAEAEVRPDPDYIVAHPFFSMHGGRNIPASLSHLCTIKQPDWLLDYSPRGDVMSSDAQCISLLSLARECGVGHFPEINHTFSVIGEDVGRSLYYEFLDEEAAGRTPLVPLPANMVYTSFVSSSPSQGTVIYHKPEKKNLRSMAPAEYQTVSKASRGGTIRSHASQLRMEAASNSTRSTEEVPKRSSIPKAPSYQQAVATARGTDRPRSNHGLLDELPIRPASRLTSESSKARTVPKNFSRVTRSATVAALPEEKSQPTKPATVRLLPSNIRVVSIGDMPVEDANQSARGGRRVPSSRTAAKAATISGKPVRRSLEKALSTADQVAEGGEIAIDRKNIDDELLLVEATSRNKPAEPISGLGNGTRRDRKVSGDEPTRSSKPDLVVKIPEVPNSLIGTEEVAESLRGTQPDEVLHMLQTLSQNLTIELQNAKKQTNNAEFPKRLGQTRTIVTRWVDYSNKFGVGYILKNGSVGCIFNGGEKRLSGGIVVPDGEDHLKNRNFAKYTERYQVVPRDGPLVEFFEHSSERGIRRVMVHPETYHISNGADINPGSFKNGVDKFDIEKRRCLNLWDKFAQYMMGRGGKSGEVSEEARHNFLDPVPPRDESKTKKANAGPYAKFYQRIGNIGLWGFGDGSLQLNFPDHTKLIISPDGRHADFYFLAPSGIKALQKGDLLPQTELDNRKELIGLSVAHLLRGTYGSKSFKESMQRNELTAKLDFAKTVVDIWIENGGLGRMGSGTELKWEGTREMKPNEKLVWVTVGAMGGDGPGVVKYADGRKC